MTSRSLAALGVALALGCMDPAEPRDLPEDIDNDRSLVVFTVLDPGASDDAGDPGPGVLVTTTHVPDSLLAGLAGTLSSTDGDSGPGTRTDDGCGYGSSIASTSACLRFPIPLRPGGQYSLHVWADDYLPVVATATIPGDFEISRAEAAGSPPGIEGLEAEWTPSAGAYRYLVAIRAAATPRCFTVHICESAWSAVTETPGFSGTLPDGALSQGDGPWTLDVYALDRHLYLYLASGTPGDLFSVPPGSNVTGGHGVVGAWVRRSVPLD